MKKSRLILWIFFIVGATLFSCNKEMSNLTQLITSTGEISYFPTDNNGGNVGCDEVALATGCTFENTSGKIDYSGGEGGTFGPITWTTDGTYVNWSSTVPVKIGIIVKGGSNASVYSSGCGSNNCTTSGTALSAPINPANGKPYGLSNITFCYTECPQPQLKLALKIYSNGTTSPTKWMCTGGGPTFDYYIGYIDFIPGSTYSLYGGGSIANEYGKLEIGNFDVDPLMEVKVTSLVSGLNFTQPYLWVGLEEDFNTDFRNYQFPEVKVLLDPAVSEVILDLPF